MQRAVFTGSLGVRIRYGRGGEGGGRKIFALLLILLFALPARNAFGCDPCGMHSAVQVPGLMNALRSTGMQADTWTFGAQEQLTTFDVRGDNDLRTTETDLELIRTLSVTQLSVGYTVTENFALQLNAPFIVRHYDKFERFERVDDTEAGFGDLSLLGTYSPYSYTRGDERVFVAVVGGVKAPTGDTGSLTRIASTNQDGSASTTIQGRGLTLGSGSVDVPLGVVAYGRTGRLLLFSSAQYTVRTEGAADYRFANDLVWSLAPGWIFLLGSGETLSTSLTISGEHKGSDHVDGDLLPRTAMNNIYVGPELFYAISNRSSLLLGVDLPVAIDVGGAAVKPETRSRIAVSFTF